MEGQKFKDSQKFLIVFEEQAYNPLKRNNKPTTQSLWPRLFKNRLMVYAYRNKEDDDSEAFGIGKEGLRKSFKSKERKIFATKAITYQKIIELGLSVHSLDSLLNEPSYEYLFGIDLNIECKDIEELERIDIRVKIQLSCSEILLNSI
jgi:hypothetical protein